MRPWHILLILLTACSSNNNTINEQHYRLGAIGAFGEMVDAGVKQLALSSVMSKEEMDSFFPEAEKIAKQNNVELYRESDLIVTDLFPADVALNKEVLIIYNGSAKDQYLQLKKEKAELEASGQYNDKAREAIARKFGRLLSYPTQKINKLLSQNTSFRTMKDFGIDATNLFLYYKDLNKATQFYTSTLGFELLADYQMAKILRLTSDSYLILVDATKGMHTADEPKTVAVALLTEQLQEWYDYLKGQNVKIKYDYKPRNGGPHDGFVVVDPEGYLLEFELFKNHRENEKFIPLLNQSPLVTAQSSTVPAGLGFKATITWLYYKDMVGMQQFYEEKLGLEQVVDQGWAKIYRASKTGYVGLVDERRGMHSFTDTKAVNVSFLIDDIDGWFQYAKEHNSFELRSQEVSAGPETKYRAFVGFDPEGYYMEFDKFYLHADNQELGRYLELTKF
ncbi:MAG TPA: VOC family protein [Cyclobacteriaceae bacterium]|nr:VOC family protein [Cyclobacteriaceae bacterium]